jgi:NAD(P)-dependent dehydrogenase (short-subunit alcohol dehydrogenase family)
MTTSTRIAITGAASGLGRELALRWARTGARVALADINGERLAEVAREVTAAGGTALLQKCDVRLADDLDALVDACAQAWGGLDVFVNNAGVAGGGSFEKLTDEDWQWLLDINLMGVVRGARAATKQFRRQGSGHIVNIASMAGLLAPPGMSSYNVAKTGVVSLSETLHGELRPFGIRVTCVCPSFFRTNLMESLRTPDAGMRKSFDRLLDTSNITAADIAGMVFNAVARGDFLCLPHRKGRNAWWLKRAFYSRYLQEMVNIGSSLARRR